MTSAGSAMSVELVQEGAPRLPNDGAAAEVILM
jgi:hypothetical protein